jgi:hypothetical protein
LIAGLAGSPVPPLQAHSVNPQLRTMTDLSSNVSQWVPDALLVFQWPAGGTAG